MLTTDGLSITHATAQTTGTATALIRPEQFFLAQQEDTAPALDVDLEQIVFVGSTFELFGRTATGRRVIAEIPAARRSLVGEIEQSRRARLAYDPAAVHLIPAEAA
ncbi:MAG: TOBE domain-containing protein [Proteobacteria bacterium]|nr:TOBE domain-containing protein [Pseudomonadota bacterium]